MSRQKRILQLVEPLNPQYFEIENESDQHAGPPGRDSHFKLLLVSAAFSGLSRLERQRRVNDILKDEFQAGLHALTQRLLTPEEWEKAKSQSAQSRLEFVSPQCGHKKSHT